MEEDGWIFKIWGWLKKPNVKEYMLFDSTDIKSKNMQNWTILFTDY